jgi:hypothetical protein
MLSLRNHLKCGALAVLMPAGAEAPYAIVPHQ